MRTVGELKQALAELPDDLPLVQHYGQDELWQEVDWDISIMRVKVTPGTWPNGSPRLQVTKDGADALYIQ